MSSLSDTVYKRVTDSLRVTIIAGEYEPGQRLVMSDLVERFGTSQMPIREALQQLQGEGLVTIYPHRGAQVRSIDRKFVSNIYDMRIALEALLIQKACEREDTSWVNDLNKAQRVHDSLIETGNISEIIEANHDFHAIHSEIADNEEVFITIERTNALVTALRVTHGITKDRLRQISKEHHEMITCFEKRDVDGVLKVHACHCENAKTTMLGQLPEKDKR